MDIRPIHTRADYDSALDRIDVLWGADVGTAEGDELEVLIDLVAAHDERNHRLAPSAPHELIRAAMEEREDGRADLARIAGSEAAAFAILRGAALSLAVIRRLSREWNISADGLIGEDGRTSGPSTTPRRPCGPPTFLLKDLAVASKKRRVVRLARAMRRHPDFWTREALNGPARRVQAA